MQKVTVTYKLLLFGLLYFENMKLKAAVSFLL